MRRFVQLYRELDQTNRTSGKVEALVRYFREAPPEDAAWAAAKFAGNKLIKSVSSSILRQLIAQEASLPPWLIDECYSEVGDLSETISLLLPEHASASGETLAQVITGRILPLDGASRDQQAQIVLAAWSALSQEERFLYHKLISTSFRVGVSRAMLIRALAELSGVPGAVIDHRLRSGWKPSAEAFARLLDPAAGDDDPQHAYPFLLAHPYEGDLPQLGDLRDFQLEWKWDGVRAQMIRRDRACVIWSRGDELLTDAFPELAQAACHLPLGTVLDGEIVAWEEDHPLPFLELQKRLNRKYVAPSFWPEVVVVYIAYDLLELGGEDIREKPLSVRRALLEKLIASLPDRELMRISQIVQADDWDEVLRLKAGARERCVEGLMIKRRDSIYAAGRPRGLWWKAKIEPFTMDAVLLAAQPGTGKRAGLFTDYTFAVLSGDQLVPIAKAYSGLNDEEIHEIDAWVRRNTLSRHGPVHMVKPEQVFELGFEAIQPSTRHRSGLAVRFPRILRWRKDKRPGEIDTLDNLRELMQKYTRPGSSAGKGGGK